MEPHQECLPLYSPATRVVVLTNGTATFVRRYPSLLDFSSQKNPPLKLSGAPLLRRGIRCPKTPSD
jgi:hypothetical protein